ncbi:MAG: metallophosphoesterase [Oscillospiraceae bacterium]|nr:metallophosphoesterase [Oscillospiraceae bacterium]
MVYVTGDVHGDIRRFKHRALRKLKKRDYLIVCGDFGFIWTGSHKENRVLKWLGRRRYTILFVEGSHDNYDLLLGYPKTPWNGGEVRRISGKLMHLCRGGVFEVDGNKIFAFGGGSSDDADIREETGTWWKEELPEPWEIEAAGKNLEAHGNTVDYIITHQSSMKIKSLLQIGDSDMNPMDAFFDEVREKVSFKKWFFGSFHMDKQIPPGETALFQSFAEMKPDGALIPGRSIKGGRKKRGKYARYKR